MLWRGFSVRFDMSFDEFMRLKFLCLMIWMIESGAHDLHIFVAFWAARCSIGLNCI